MRLRGLGQFLEITGVTVTIRNLLAELEGEVNRRAQFRTGYLPDRGREKRLFEGIVNKFEENAVCQGLDLPGIVPEGYEETFAEMGMKKKTASAIVPVRFSKLCVSLR